MRFGCALALIGPLSACAHSAAAPEAQREQSPLEDSYVRAYNSEDPAVYRAVRDQHAAALARHPERETRVRYGKLLYALGELAEAAKQFGLAAAGENDHLARGAARNAIVALTRKETTFRPLKSEGRIDRTTLTFEIAPIVLPDFNTGDDVAERTLAEPERRLADACDRYFEIADAQDTALPTIRLLSAEIYFRHRRAGEGAKRCADIVARWPHEPIAVSCVRATIDALNAKSAWVELEKHARAFRGNLSLVGADHELERRLEEIVQASAFKRIQMDAEVKTPDRTVERARLVAGAEAFRAFQREFPYSTHSDKALYNAFVYYVRAEKRAEALQTAQLLIAQYRDSPLVREAKQQMKAVEGLAFCEGPC